jgi:hypothetical protein
MKKTTITLTAALFMTATIFAQGADKDYSVKEGDWSIGINASPFLNYAGGFFSNAGAAAPTFNATAQSPASITGGYALSSDMTAFGVLTIGVTASTVNGPDGDANDEPDNVTKTSAATIGVVGGLTRRIGTGRLQGNFGGGVALGSTSNGGKTTNIDNVANSENSTKTGSTINYGVVGVAGVEFFLCPQISLGAAYRILAGGSSTGDNTSTNAAGATTTASFGGSSAAVNTAGTGSLIMSFYLR